MSGARKIHVFVTDGRDADIHLHALDTLLRHVPDADVHTFTVGGLYHRTARKEFVHDVTDEFLDVYGCRPDDRSSHCCGRFPNLVFARFLAPLLLGRENIVYTDNDIEVVSPGFAEIYGLPAQKEILAAEETPAAQESNIRRIERTLGVSVPGRAYRNSGVLVMNVTDRDAWRQKIRLMWQMQRVYKFRLADQDAAFSVLDFGDLDTKFNRAHYSDLTGACLVHYNAANGGKAKIAERVRGGAL